MAPLKGMVAAGDRTTAEAAAEMLRDGGNAYDAVLAGLAMSCIAEPVLSSLAGGGFLTAKPAGKPAVVHDFFCQTPGICPPVDTIEFNETHVDFGTAVQDFHHGAGSVAVPGVPAGIEAIHNALCSLPLSRIFEPAIDAARNGHSISELQGFILGAVRPIFLATQSARSIFGSDLEGQDIRSAGETLVLPDLAETLACLAEEGSAPFYQGHIADKLVEFCKSNGGIIQKQDLQDYHVIERPPLAFTFANADISINPAPSLGGSLIAFTLGLLTDQSAASEHHRSELIAHALSLTSDARHASGMNSNHPTEGIARLLDPGNIQQYRGRLAKKIGGTTHISVVDSDGNAAAMTLSNGEGAGHVLDGTDIMLNNMLGEEDTNPMGFFEWLPNTRISSMMSPAIVETDDNWVYAIGSGGSNRIRSAIAQTLLNILDLGMSPKDAIDAPRLHNEKGLLCIEGGHDEETTDHLAEQFDQVQNWGEGNFFFGGVHMAGFNRQAGSFAGAGDPRRGGIALTV